MSSEPVDGSGLQTISPAVHVEVKSRIARVFVDRPPVNAFSSGLYEQLRQNLEEVAVRDDVSCVVLGSALDGIFSAGADLKEIGGRPDAGTLIDERAHLAGALFSGVLKLPVPVIAVVTGQALGAGCVLSSVCDLRVASPQAVFRLPEIDVGMLGGARHMLRVLPRGQARLMSFTARPLSAVDAHRLGFVDLLAEDPEAAWALADEVARELASKPPHALRLAKAAADESEDLPLLAGYRVEQHHTARLVTRERDAAGHGPEDH